MGTRGASCGARTAGCLALALAACGGDPSGPRGGRIAQLWIGATRLSLGVGDTARMRVRAGDGDDNVLHEWPATVTHSWPAGLPARWRSSDPSTVAVDSSGAAVAVRPGRAHIYVEANGARDSGTVVVHAAGGGEQLSYASVGAGRAFTCGLAASGSALCWGSNWWGELAGGPRRRHTGYLSPGAAARPHTFTALAVGASHACGLTPDGSAYCWGAAAEGKLGNPAADWTAGEGSPVPVTGGPKLRLIAAGPTHTCGADQNGAAYCWGSNVYGQLGDGAAGAGTSRAAPRAVKTALEFVQITLGLDHSCGLSPTGVAYCWGSNAVGQLGSGASDRVSGTPVAVAGNLSFARLEAGTAHTCGLTPEGKAYCWGRNWYGQLGHGATAGVEPAPVAVAGGLAFTDVSGGGDHTCGVTGAGEAYCWGHNWRGQLGTGFDFAARGYTAADLIKRSPVRVAGDVRFATISAGYSDHTCAVTTTGETYCWGESRGGQLGFGAEARVPATELTVRASPVRVAPPL